MKNADIIKLIELADKLSYWTYRHERLPKGVTTKLVKLVRNEVIENARPGLPGLPYTEAAIKIVESAFNVTIPRVWFAAFQDKNGEVSR